VSRVLIAGGGTGGHLYPGLAVAEALRERWPEIEITFVGTDRGIESTRVPEAGYPLRRIPVRGFPRRPSWGWITFWFTLARGMVQAWRLVRSLKPAVVVGTGGYVSAPTVWAAWVSGVPVVLMEQNRLPGLATRVTAPFARCICLAFEDSKRFFPRRDNVRVTGNPVRRRVVERADARGPRERVRILAFGGSRGARQVNVLLADALGQLPRTLPVEFIVQTGEADLGWVAERFDASGFTASVRAYLERIEDAYAAADLVVSRAGATTIAEITAGGLPSILIPYPYAAARHQEVNAAFLAEAGAAEVLDPRTATAVDLARVIRELVEDGARRESMAARARALGRPGAAVEVAELVAALAFHR